MSLILFCFFFGSVIFIFCSCSEDLKFERKKKSQIIPFNEVIRNYIENETEQNSQERQTRTTRTQ